MAKCLEMLASPKKEERNIICQHRLAHTVGAFTKLAQAHTMLEFAKSYTFKKCLYVCVRDKTLQYTQFGLIRNARIF